MLKHSVQRDSILNFLSARHDHPTAETIYLGVRQELPNISLATVYRNLTLLDDIGLIQRIRTGNGPDRFDGHPEPHNHFICRECGRVIDLEMDSIERINDIAGRSFGGTIEGHRTWFYGKCPDCLAKEQEPKS